MNGIDHSPQMQNLIHSIPNHEKEGLLLFLFLTNQSEIEAIGR